MNCLIEQLEKNKKFQEYLQNIKEKISPINISGLSDVGKTHIIGTTVAKQKQPACIITYNEIQAKKLLKDLKFFLPDYQIEYFPQKEISPYDYDIQSKDILYERMKILNQIENEKIDIVVTTIECIMQKLPPKELIYQNIMKFQVGSIFKMPNQRLNLKGTLEEVKEVLILLGYERKDIVETKGQFSIRGGIVDIGIFEKNGVRIEFWGDEIDSIRYFNLSSQRSTEMINEITIYPAHEFLVDNLVTIDKEEIENSDKGMIPLYSKNLEKITNRIQEKYKNAQVDVEIIKNGDYLSKIDKYFNEFYEKQENLINFLPKNSLIYVDEITKILQRRENIMIDNNHLIQSLVEKERFVPEAIENLSQFSIKEWEKIEKERQTIFLHTNITTRSENKYEFNYREINLYKSELDLLITDLKNWIKEKKNIVIVAGNEIGKEKIENLLKQNEMILPKIEIGSLSSGFESYDLNLIVISLIHTFEGEMKRKKVSNNFKQGEKIVFADLKQGDFVVHRSHGIGQFIGVNTITADNITKDYIKIKYKNEDVLYVPTNNLDNVRKYIGAGESAPPKLNKLGSKEWANTKTRVKKNLQEIAKDLIELYAKRQKVKGFAFSEDTEWQRQFEDNFPYQETDDQLKCIAEVKKDMQMPRPMDRLLCGDVGYGKTEVAIRAAFKAVMDQKQVAYLVPTTILANQQYEEFKTRMEEFAIKVELLNRFRTKKEQEEIVKKLKLGEVDVVVGTHRILSKDLEFKDLGLLIIDEEHRFGVKDKEKIKQLKNNIDVLTMTATPIPRTLHMSIVGVRDMSVIYEPPQDRRPVQTYVLEYDTEVIKEAITRELERDGQVFYLFNNVEGIERKALEISNLVPEAKVEFAHGKMTGKELEEIMGQFIHKEINVLVCTTILESGIDIPNANTIIVENADRLGLAQLYQIRGRVGRSDKQAYAYITYKRDKLLNEVADKRLKAIKEFTEFGSGFKIAMRDLEIRGAGSLLGELQHGHMEQVGYDTYCKLLDEVVKEMQGIEVKEEQEVQIDMNISSYIPDSYIDNSSQKIEVYQNIALCRNEQDIQNVIDEIIDRYGPMPKELESLIEIARIKEQCKKSNVIKIAQRMQSLVFYFNQEKYDPKIIDELIKKYEFYIKFSTGVEPYITLKIGECSDKELIVKTKEFLQQVSENTEK